MFITSIIKIRHVEKYDNWCIPNVNHKKTGKSNSYKGFYDDDLDNTPLIPPHEKNTESYQKLSKGAVSHNVLKYQQLSVAHYQVSFYAYSYFE